MAKPSKGQTLSRKQKIFIAEYLKCFSGAEAARRAGYSEASIYNIASETLSKPYIREIIEKEIKDRGLGTEKRFKKTASSFIYLIRAENGLVKIGKTNNLVTRFSALDVGSPINLELIHYTETPYADEIEEKLHALYKDKRVKGEWFSLSVEDIKDIISEYGT